MKKYLAGAAAVAAILAPCVASAETNAVVGLEYGNTDVGSFDADNYGFNAAFSHDLNNGHFIQFDGAHLRTDDLGGCCNGMSYGAFHYGVRNDNHAIAGFVSLTDFFAYSGVGIGVEGSLYMNNMVFNGSIGHVDFDDLDVSATSFDVDGSYYFTPNFSLTGAIGHTEGDGGFDGSWTSYGIGGEWRPDGHGFSISAGYRNTDYDDFGIDADTWTLGVNFDLGTGSLRERANRGPSQGGGERLFNALSFAIA